MELNKEKYTEIESALETEATKYGLEIHPFKVGWYNEALSDKKFEFSDDPNTLAFIVISTPTMFEKAFLPFLIFERILVFVCLAELGDALLNEESSFVC